MTTIYYLTTILFLWLEMRWLNSPIEKTNEVKEFMELHKQNKGKKWDDFTDEYKSAIKNKMPYILIVLWMFVGLLTFQWIAYLVFLLFQIIIIAPLSKLTRYSIAYTIIHWINSLIGFSFGVFVIVNHYHLKLDLTSLVTKLLNL